MLGRVLAAFFILVSPLAFSQGAVTGTAPPVAAAEPVKAGKVDLVEGDVRFFNSGQRMRRPRVGDPILEGESIVTGSNGEVHLLMEDGGYIGVRPGTKMRITNFRAEGDADDRSVIGLLEGSFRSVTGWIARLGPNRAVVRTPTAVIGIRGTEHEPLFIPESSTLGDPGTYDRVHIGETEIRTSQGAISVRPNQAGYATHRGTGPPRVLARVPNVFRPTRNEGKFEGLHAKIHARLDQQRGERRQLIEQRHKPQGARPQEGAAKIQREDARKADREARIEGQKRKQQERHDKAMAEKADRGAKKTENDKRHHEQGKKSNRE